MVQIHNLGNFRKSINSSYSKPTSILAQRNAKFMHERAYPVQGKLVCKFPTSVLPAQRRTLHQKGARAGKDIANPVQGKLVCTFPACVFPLRGQHFTRKKPAQGKTAQGKSV